MTFMQSMWSPSQQPSLEIIAKVGDPVPIAAWWTGRILQARNPVYISCPERGSNQGPLDRGAEREPLHHHADKSNLKFILHHQASSRTFHRSLISRDRQNGLNKLKKEGDCYHEDIL